MVCSWCWDEIRILAFLFRVKETIFSDQIQNNRNRCCYWEWQGVEVVTHRMLWTLVSWGFVGLGEVLCINTTSLRSLDVSKGGTPFIVTTFWNNRNKQTKNRHSLMIKCTGPLRDLLISCREQSHHRHCWRNWGVFQPFWKATGNIY